MAASLWGKVYYDDDRFAGELRQEPGGRCVFTYDRPYLEAHNPPIAFTLPAHRLFDKKIEFWGQDGPQRVLCRVSREALDDHFSDRGRLRPEAAFRKYRKEIEGLARRKYVSGRREPDGSILIRTADIA